MIYVGICAAVSLVLLVGLIAVVVANLARHWPAVIAALADGSPAGVRTPARSVSAA